MLNESHKPPPQHVGVPFVPPRGANAELHIDGKCVGRIVVTGWHSTWTLGRFTPAEGFAPYATMFGRWSLLMHEDEHKPLHTMTSDALADAERAIDSLHIRVYFPDQQRWHEVRQLNIDGEQLEWKEF